MKKAALYVRVSTQEQKERGLSVDNQIEALTQYCKENELDYQIYNDAGISAHVSYKKRPQLLQLIEDCKAGNVDVILFTRIDRFFRSIKDYYLVMDQISVPWKAIWEDYETETSSGQFKVNIMLSISEAEAARTSEKIKSVFDYKRAMGEYVGTAPLGLKVENRQLVKDPEKEAVTELMFSTFLATRSTLRTIEALCKAGVNCNIATLKIRLKNEAYIGRYITQEQHDIIIADLATRSRTPKRTNHPYIFAGLITCSYCGQKLGGSSNIMRYDENGEPVRKWYYICHGQKPPHLHPSMTICENKLEKILLENLDQIIGDTNVKKLETAPTKKMVDISKLEAKLERIGIRFEDGDFSVEEYRKKRKQIQEEIREAKNLNKPIEPVVLPDNWKDIYADLTPENRKTFWRSIILNIQLARENKNDLSSAITFR